MPDTYLVYRIGATEVGEADRPFLADLSLMKVDLVSNPTKSITFPTLTHGDQTINVTLTNDGWIGNNTFYKVRFRSATLETKSVLIGLAIFTKGNKNIIDSFFAEKITINFDAPSQNYSLTYAWESNSSVQKTLTVSQNGAKKEFLHVKFDAASTNETITAKTPGLQAAGRFTTTETNVTGRLIHGWAIPFQNKTAIIGHVTRPAQKIHPKNPDPTDPVEPFVAIST